MSRLRASSHPGRAPMLEASDGHAPGKRSALYQLDPRDLDVLKECGSCGVLRVSGRSDSVHDKGPDAGLKQAIVHVSHGSHTHTHEVQYKEH